MPQKLEIIIGDRKNIGKELAIRTIKKIIERKKSERPLPEESLTLAKERGIYFHKEFARKSLKDYVLACAKGSIALEYYQALRESHQDFSNVAAFAIDEDWATTDGHDFLLENMPHDTSKHSIFAGVIKYTKETWVEEPIKLSEFKRRGRVLDPIDVIHDGIPCGVNNLNWEYEIAITTFGGIDTAIIGLGVNPLHIGSNFPLHTKVLKRILQKKSTTRPLKESGMSN